MKRITLMLKQFHRRGLVTSLFLSVALLQGCVTIPIGSSSSNSSLSIDFVPYFEQLENDLPLYITSSFELPIIDTEGVTTQWYFNNQVIEDNYFIYEAPFESKEISLTAQLTKLGLQTQFSFDILLRAIDSPEFITPLFLQIPTGLNSVNLETYVGGELFFSYDNNGKEETFSSLLNVRGRGNSTWYLSDKKPLRLHFDNEESLLGMKESNDYVLLAEYADKSLIRNVMAHKLSKLFTYLPYTFETRFVELTVNNEYRGLYVLTEQVETTKEKYYIETNLNQLDAGFFLELDWRLNDEKPPNKGIDWFYANGIPYKIDTPDTSEEGYTQFHTTYISNYIVQLESALTKKSGYEDLIDIDNFIDYFIINEIAKNVDVGFSSFYFAKPIGEKLQLGPIWDFDLAFGNADYIDYGPEGFYGFNENKNRWFYLMMQIEEVRLKFRNRFNELYVPMVSQWLPLIDHMREPLEEAAEKNFEKWVILDHYVWPNPQEMVAETTYEGQLDYLEDYIVERLNWLDMTLNDPSFLSIE